MVTIGWRQQDDAAPAVVDRLLATPVMIALAALVFVVTIALSWSRSAAAPSPDPIPAVGTPPAELPSIPGPATGRSRPLLPPGTYSDLPSAHR